MLKLTVFVPESHLEPVKNALFQAGAGHIGNYHQCCWQTQGVGQFKPLPGSEPHIGEQGLLSSVTEWRVEMMVVPENITQVITALKQNHPYETPAYDVIKVVDI